MSFDGPSFDPEGKKTITRQDILKAASLDKLRKTGFSDEQIQGELDGMVEGFPIKVFELSLQGKGEGNKYADLVEVSAGIVWNSRGYPRELKEKVKPYLSLSLKENLAE